MVYLYQNSEGKNLIMERDRKGQVVLYSQENGRVLPLLKCENPRLSIIFSDLSGKLQRRAVGIEWNETQQIVRFLLEPDVVYDHQYKPSSMLYYDITISPSIDYGNIQLSFNVYYCLWRKVDDGSGGSTFKKITTDKRYYEYNLSSKEYMNLLTLVNIYDEHIASRLLYNAYNGQIETGEEDSGNPLAYLGYGHGTCDSFAGELEKIVDLNNYVLTVGGIITVTFKERVMARSYLNVNNQGLRQIRHLEDFIKDDVIQAGDTATFTYDGNYYLLLSVSSTSGMDYGLVN